MASLTKKEADEQENANMEGTGDPYGTWGMFVHNSIEFAPWALVTEVTEPEFTVLYETEEVTVNETTVRIRYTMGKDIDEQE